MLSTLTRAQSRPSEAAAPPSGARSGALVAGASAVSIVANYVFLLAAGRVLGSAGYGALAALLGLLAVVLIPAGALQMAVSREISRRIASDDATGAHAFARTALRASVIATVPLVVVAFVLAVPFADLLHIHSLGVVVLADATLVTALVFPVALGVIQGVQRFHALAALYIAPFLIRLPLFGILAALGYRLGAAIFATLAGSLAATALALALIREPLAGHGTLRRSELRPFLRYLTPVAAGLVGIALLTHVDILVVKARLSADAAGAYAAASAFARVGFFLPATILAVLFPRTAARQARGEQTEDILGRSLLAAVGFCALLSLFYAAAGRGIVTLTFGPSFAQGGDVLAPFAIAIGFYSLAYILVGYHLSRGETRYAWIVAGGVLVQLATLALVPRTLHSVVWANVIVAAALLVAHELFVGSSAPALRAGARRLVVVTPSLRAALVETAAALFVFTVFVCVLFWPVLLHFGSTIIGSPGSDSTGSVSTFWQMQHEGGFHILGSTHHSMSGAPFGWNQTNIINLQLLLPYYPTYLASIVIGPIAAYNLITLAGYVLSGLSMYLFVRYLGCARSVAAWAGVAFVVFPFHIAHEEHASLLHLECLVLVLFALVAAARRPAWPRLALVGLANLCCWLMSGYFGPMAFVATVAFAAAAALTERRRGRWLFAVGSGASAVVAAGIVGVATIASGTNSGLGLNRLPEDLSTLGFRAYDLLVPPVGNIVLGHGLDSFWLRHSHGSNVTEISNYLGLLTLGLAIGWLVVAVRRRTTLRAVTAGLTATFVAGLLFGLPSPLFGVPMPSRLMWRVIPAMHVPSRWDFLLMTALVPLAALGLERLRRALSRKNAALALGVVCAAVVVSFLELTVHPARPRWRTTPVPAEYTALQQTPRGILAEYPLGHSDLYSIWQRVHGRPLLDNAPEDSPADSARLMVLDPAEPGTAQALSLLGVTAITFHPGSPVDTPIEPREPAAKDGYRLVARAPDGTSVWDVTAPAEPVFAVLAGFAPPQRMPQGSIGYTFAAGSGVGAVQLTARAPATVRLFFDAAPPAGKPGVLRLADANGEKAITLDGRTHVSVVVAVPRGQSQLLFKADGPVVVSTPRTERTSAQPELNAELVDASPGI